jgi:hypothetical protein
MSKRACRKRQPARLFCHPETYAGSRTPCTCFTASCIAILVDVAHLHTTPLSLTSALLSCCCWLKPYVSATFQPAAALTWPQLEAKQCRQHSLLVGTCCTSLRAAATPAAQQAMRYIERQTQQCVSMPETARLMLPRICRSLLVAHAFRRACSAAQSNGRFVSRCTNTQAADLNSGRPLPCGAGWHRLHLDGFLPGVKLAATAIDGDHLRARMQPDSQCIGKHLAENPDGPKLKNGTLLLMFMAGDISSTVCCAEKGSAPSLPAAHTQTPHDETIQRPRNRSAASICCC